MRVGQVLRWSNKNKPLINCSLNYSLHIALGFKISKILQRPMETAATALTGTHEHIDAYAALHMDPNAEECTVARNL